MAVADRLNRLGPRLVAGFVLLIGCTIGLHYLARWRSPGWQPWGTIGLALLCVVLGVGLIRTFVSVVAERSLDYLGVVRVQSARSLLAVVLYLILALTVAGQTEIDLSGIALSGAVTGVIVGIAAQGSIANVVAGLVLLFSRPFRPGEYVTVRAAAFAGSEYSGMVREITLFYTALQCATREVRVPNSAMVTSVVTLRPQMLEIYVPVLIPAGAWSGMAIGDIEQRLTRTLPPGREVFAAVERMGAGNVQLGIRASVASEEERHILEEAMVEALGSRTAPVAVAVAVAVPSPAGPEP
jgi:hypothetical protein